MSFQRFVGMLWSHVRNVDVEVYSTRVVYRIPIYGEGIVQNKVISADVLDNTLVLTMVRRPPPDPPVRLFGEIKIPPVSIKGDANLPLQEKHLK